MNLGELRRYEFSPIEQSYSFKDAILYALSLGYDGACDEERRFVTENDQCVVPTFCNVLCHPGFWLRDVPQLGFDWRRVLHGEQMLRILRPLPVAAAIRAQHRIIAVEDRKEKGAVVYLEKTIELAASGEPLATARWTIFARGDGGAGGFGALPVSPAPLIAGEPEQAVEIAISPRAALLYRLSGDMNPIHADPEAARQAGFDRPILHGLCTMGIACRAILQAYCGSDPSRLKSMFVRFSQPVFPGETVRVEFFREDTVLRFRVLVQARQAIVLDRGSAEIA
ncbi:MaoC/PaaZ C-terminal domain-containing protein [Ferrovibrio sp.]|uniref:MaoC family dehydratase n=1 Tax=Ferrovibrio sp. TaxID=1917215 RepID=UPI003D0E4825